MARYRITGPDGGSYEITAPDNATEQDVLDYVRQNAAAPEEPFATRMTRQFKNALVPGGDRLSAAFGAGIDTLSGAEGTFGDNYDRRLQQEWQRTDAANRSAGAGDVLAKAAGYTMGGLGLLKAPLMASNLPANATLPQVAAESARIGAPIGAAQAYAESRADNGAGRFADTGAGAVGGAAMGYGVPYALAVPGAVKSGLRSLLDRLTGRTPQQRAQMEARAQELEAAGIAREQSFGPALREGGDATAESLSRSFAGAPLRESAERNAQLLQQNLQRELAATGAATGHDEGASAQAFLRRQLEQRNLPQSHLESMSRADLDAIDSRGNQYHPDRRYVPDRSTAEELQTRQEYDRVFREPTTHGTAFRRNPGYTYPDELGARYEHVNRDIPRTVRAPVAVTGEGAQGGQPNQVYHLLDQLRGELRSRGLLRGDNPDVPIFHSPASDAFGRELERRLPRDIVASIYSRAPLGVQDLRRIRTAVREAADTPPAQRRFDPAFLQRMEGALTTDIFTLLDRSPNLARAGSRMRRNDEAYRLYMSDMVAPLRRVMGENVGAEQAINRLVAAAGTGQNADLQLLRAFYRTHADKGDVRRATAAIVGQMAQDGLPAFVQGMRNLSPQARQLMGTGQARELMQAVARFERVAEPLLPYLNQAPRGLDLARVPNMVVAGSVLANIWLGIATFAGQAALARFMSGPRYVRWLTDAARIGTAGPNSTAWRQHMGRLAAIAQNDGEIGRSIVEAVGNALRPEQARAAPRGMDLQVKPEYEQFKPPDYWWVPPDIDQLGEYEWPIELPSNSIVDPDTLWELQQDARRARRNIRARARPPALMGAH